MTRWGCATADSTSGLRDLFLEISVNGEPKLTVPVSAADLDVWLLLSDAQIAAILSPRHFVEVRQTPGGPAPVETARAIARSREVLAADRSWMTGTSDRLARANGLLHSRAQAL